MLTDLTKQNVIIPLSIRETFIQNSVEDLIDDQKQLFACALNSEDFNHLDLGERAIMYQNQDKIKAIFEFMGQLVRQDNAEG